MGNFCRENLVFKPMVARRSPSIRWGFFFRTRLSKPGKRAKRKGCLSESRGPLESSGSGAKLTRCGQITLAGTEVRQ